MQNHKIVYSSFNIEVFAKVPINALNILDVGCGTGIMGKVLKQQRKDRIICGVTYSKDEYVIANQVLDKVWIADINKETPMFDGTFDCIIFSHVLEHTYQPEKVLADFSSFLNKEGVIIVALPNILHFRQRIKFLSGSFQYSANGGLMDITHYRFYDWVTAQKMIISAGLRIIAKEGHGNFPLPFFRVLFPVLGKIIDRRASRLWPGLFGFQFVFAAKK
ncbi:MAG: class I SAM-dependent methyltransferase [Chitinophagaceae bacterium]